MNFDIPGAKSQKPDPQQEAKEKLERINGEFREFVFDEISFLGRKKLETVSSAMSPKDILKLLGEYWNPPASFEHFQGLMLTLGDLPPDIKFAELSKEDLPKMPQFREKYLKYLMHKLPVELQELHEKRIEAAEDDPKKLEAAYAGLEKAASRETSGLALGMHTSTIDFGEVEPGITEVKPTPSNDVFFVKRDGKEVRVEDDTAKSWYSANPKKLYAAKGTPEYLYIVEASRGDLSTERFYDKGHEAFYTHAPLKVRHKIHLDPDVRIELFKQFDLDFGKFSEL